jgi:hypothetical protein
MQDRASSPSTFRIWIHPEGRAHLVITKPCYHAAQRNNDLLTRAYYLNKWISIATAPLMDIQDEFIKTKLRRELMRSQHFLVMDRLATNHRNRTI